jgi:hypothetical protein
MGRCHKRSRCGEGARAYNPADARDGALLALGWGAALRRSELVNLDWMKFGDGAGFVRIEPERGIVVRLQRSKSSQDKAVEIVIPYTDMPTCCIWLEQWAKVAKLEPGQPVFGPSISTRSLPPIA